MDDISHLKRQLGLAEELLNIVDAMRPDLPARELYDLALQMLSNVGDYSAGSLWTYAETLYQSAVWTGLDRRRGALVKGATIGEAACQQFLSQLTAHSGMHWGAWPLPPGTPEPLQPPPGEGQRCPAPRGCAAVGTGSC